MRVLVTWGSKRGGTEGIARILGEELRRAGLDVELLPAEEARSAATFDAVIVGGALYMNRWHRAARRFVARREADLRRVPVWFFSSGPLDDSAEHEAIPPTRQVQALMDRVGARGHVTFGGRLTQDARGFPASAMAKTHAGDWRHPERVRAWASELARALPAARPQRVVARPRRFAWVLLGALDLFVATTALSGGAALALRPDGSLVQLTIASLRHSPFRDFLVPGLILFLVIGCGHLFGGVQAFRRRASGAAVSYVMGSGLMIWVVSELLLLQAFHWLQVLFFVAGAVIALDAMILQAPPRPSIAPSPKSV